MRRKAFTLVEIMIVVLIIGILMAIAVPNFVKARDGSRKSSCISSLKQISGAKEQWAMDNKKDTGATVAFSDLVGSTLYIRGTPTCPSGGTYTVNVLGTNPACDKTGHVLP
jgi:prepilin-type N-terminal cleavage/methylation domain-containing protein